MYRLIFNTHDIILLVTIYQVVLYVALIFAIKRDRHQSDYFLIAFLLAQAAIPFHILINYGEAFRYIALEFSPNLYRIFEIAYWLEGPLLLWYTRSISYKKYRLRNLDMLFLIPVCAFIIYNFATFYTLDKQTKIDFFIDYKTLNAGWGHHLAGLFREVFRVFCSVLCLVEIHRCRRRMRDQYSSIEKIDLGWLNFLVIVFFILQVWAVIVSLAIISSAHLFINLNFDVMGLIGNYTAFVLVTALIFFNLSRSSFLVGVDQPKSHNSEKALRSDTEIDPEIIKRIEIYMETEKPYLANILTLEQLSGQLDMPPRTLSNIINRHFKQNFFEFINHYRIEEAKLQLANPELRNKTMIEIMGDCGFNSKATFNTFFKKIVNATPSQYREKQLP